VHAQVDGIMEVSRSIGDAELKKHGVISTPGIERITFCARDEFLLLGCDGDQAQTINNMP